MCEELKNWIPKHSKRKTCVGVELRAGGDLHRSENPRWSASDTGQWPQKKKCLGIQFLPREFCWWLISVMTCSMSVNWLILIMTCLKSAKWGILIMTCSKSAKCVPILVFLWLKIAINFQKWIYRGMVDIFFVWDFREVL